MLFILNSIYSLYLFRYKLRMDSFLYFFISEVIQSTNKSSRESSPVDIPQLPKLNQEKDQVAHSSSYPGTETLSRRWKKEEKQYPVDGKRLFVFSLPVSQYS